MKKKVPVKRKIKRPSPFGHPNYPAFDFHISHGTVQVYPIRSNCALYGAKFHEFKKWLDQVKAYAEQEPKFPGWRND